MKHYKHYEYIHIYYKDKGLVRSVNGMLSPELVTKEILAVLQGVEDKLVDL